MAEYAFNPLSGKLDRIGNGGGGGATITIAGDSGTPLNSDAFDIVGQDAASAPMVTVDTSTGDVVIANNGWGTPYVVDQSSEPGLKGTFQTIQSALDAAVTDGMLYTSPRVILIRVGNYIEDLLIPGGAYFLSYSIGSDNQFVQPTIITGNHTLPEIGVFYSKGISWIAAEGDIFTSGSTAMLLFAEDSKFTTVDPGKYINCTAQASIELKNCSFWGSVSNSIQKLSYTSGSMIIQNCQLNSAGILGAGYLSINNSDNIGQVTFGDGIISINNALMKSEAENITINSESTSGYVNNTIFISNSVSNYAVEGTHPEVISLYNCSILPDFTGPMAFFDPTITANCPVLTQSGNVINSTLRSTSDYIVGTGFEGYIGVNNTSTATTVEIFPKAKNYMVYIADEVGLAEINNIVVQVANGGTINGAGADVIDKSFGAKLYLCVDGYNFIILASNFYLYGPSTAGRGGVINWFDCTSFAYNMSAGFGYLSNCPTNNVTFVLPTTAAFGTILEVTNLQESYNFTITQGVGQSVLIGALSTTVGTGGSISSTSRAAALRMVCIVENTTWKNISSSAAISIV